MLNKRKIQIRTLGFSIWTCIKSPIKLAQKFKITQILFKTEKSQLDLSSLNSNQRDMATEEESIEQAAASRRERLKALKAAQELLNAPDEDSAQAAENQTDDTNEEE